MPCGNGGTDMMGIVITCDNIYEHINGPTLVRCFILLYDTNMYFNLLPSMVTKMY